MNKTTVSFYKQGGSFPGLNKELGNISQNELETLLELLSTVDLLSNDCITEFKIKTTESHYRQSGGKLLPYTKSLSFTDFYFGGLKLPCIENHIERDVVNANNLFRVENCYNHLISGECKCPFMQKTFGAVLFPHLYKDKSK